MNKQRFTKIFSGFCFYFDEKSTSGKISSKFLLFHRLYVNLQPVF